jgi:perosamine synthetase
VFGSSAGSAQGPESAGPYIPLYVPDLSGREAEYLAECTNSGWISSRGPYVRSFEKAFEEYTGAKYALTVANGTVALHLALLGLFGPDGLTQDDEIVVPTLTYVATVNAIRLVGAKPRFVDIDPLTWLMDPAAVRKAITSRTRAILPVHLYSGMCDMVSIIELAEEFDLRVIEDAAEAFGTHLGGKHAGTFADVGTFSFFGNKTITTGEGGMVVCHEETLKNRMWQLKSQGVQLNPSSVEGAYFHEVFGLNYRMNNVTAAIGQAQIERASSFISRKREIATFYRRELASEPLQFQVVAPTVESAEWLVSFMLPREAVREKFMNWMREVYLIETRPTFVCAHQLPMYSMDGSFPVAEEVSARGVSLPSWPGLTNHLLGRIVAAVRDSLKESME